ncbi:hypothetical protein EOK75_00320 [Pseudorhodobacter turbinis]|uniref:Type I secretion protein n=1 Tax=Pseudorhodobacter turbinis TaxID=2500533 RepID=A0A4P8EC44_9RHOB|nr:hypothetical protein [Pseudorhodobacter turbinis]QCO54411.1 hypothetical protein EOK75_00320 [Pseudorhodobacter turbinis]
MSLDVISEKIAHFIGAFELIEQETRLRAEYDKFRAIKAAEDDARAIELRSLKSKESYKLEDVDAGVKMKALPQEKQSMAELAPPPVLAPLHLPVGTVAPVLGIGQLNGPPVTANNAVMTFNLPPPSSVAQVTYQGNMLSDNDSFGPVSGGGFQTVSTLIETLHSVYAAVTSILPMGMDVLPSSGNWPGVLGDIKDAAAAIGSRDSGTLTTTVLLGHGAHGTFIDGVAAEEFTFFKEIQPTYIAGRIAEAEAALTPHDATKDGHDFDADFGKDQNPLKLDAGLSIVAGANSLVNTASISSTWLDAEMIVVAGDVVRMDAISQVNVIIDHDFVTTALSPAGLENQGSTASNAAKIETKTVVSSEEEAREPDKSSADDVAVSLPPAFANAPANWAVVRYEGSVTQINWVKQYTFTTDFDQAVVAFSGGATFLGMGENSLSNSFNINEAGYHYDLILIAGSLIDINLISQLNILLDSDVVDATAAEKGAPSQATANNAPAEIHPSFAAGSVDTAAQTADAPSSSVSGTGVDGLSQQSAAIGGHLTEQTVPETMEPAPNEADVSDGTMPDGPASEAPFSTGDNLAYNQASIETIGEDTDAEINQTFTDVLAGFALGHDDIPDEVVQDPAFLGTELLRVLYIDGDFTTVNMVDQINVLGDADEVHLARDSFADDLQAMIKVTTGSNITANIAGIKDKGMDSTVMAKGDTYSDALIYQANLMDTGLMETGSSVTDLANEAVAFLTDDIGPDTLGDDITSMTNGMIADAIDQSDVLQSMLS